MSVSVQYEHPHIILYNPFFVCLSIRFGTGQCKQTISGPYPPPASPVKSWRLNHKQKKTGDGAQHKLHCTHLKDSHFANSWNVRSKYIHFSYMGSGCNQQTFTSKLSPGSMLCTLCYHSQLIPRVLHFDLIAKCLKTKYIERKLVLNQSLWQRSTKHAMPKWVLTGVVT